MRIKGKITVLNHVLNLPPLTNQLLRSEASIKVGGGISDMLVCLGLANFSYRQGIWRNKHHSMKS